MAGLRRTFWRRLDDLLAALDVSHATFYRLAGKLKRRSWLDWHCADGLIELTMLENPVSRTTVLPVSKTAVLGVSKTAHEVANDFEVARISEEARSTPKSKSTQDVRSAKNADAHPLPVALRCERNRWIVTDRGAVPCPGCEDCQPKPQAEIVQAMQSARQNTMPVASAPFGFRELINDMLESPNPPRPPLPDQTRTVDGQWTLPAPAPQGEPRRHPRTQSLPPPPLPPDEFLDCWSIINNRCGRLNLDGPPLRRQRVNAVLCVAKSEGFLNREDDLDNFDTVLRQLAEQHVRIKAKQGFRMICDALREVLGYDDDAMLGTMGPEADFPDCPRAVYVATHGEVA